MGLLVKEGWSASGWDTGVAELGRVGDVRGGLLTRVSGRKARARLVIRAHVTEDASESFPRSWVAAERAVTEGVGEGPTGVANEGAGPSSGWCADVSWRAVAWRKGSWIGSVAGRLV